jgi:hypothetical protein
MAAMEPNPYKAPREPGYGESNDSGGPWNSDRATQLLTEIRDLQRESLAITRDAVARNNWFLRLAMGALLFLLLIVGLYVAMVIYAVTTSPPPRPQPRSTAVTMP